MAEHTIVPQQDKTSMLFWGHPKLLWCNADMCCSTRYWPRGVVLAPRLNIMCCQYYMVEHKPASGLHALLQEREETHVADNLCNKQQQQQQQWARWWTRQRCRTNSIFFLVTALVITAAAAAAAAAAVAVAAKKNEQNEQEEDGMKREGDLMRVSCEERHIHGQQVQPSRHCYAMAAAAAKVLSNCCLSTSSRNAECEAGMQHAGCECSGLLGVVDCVYTVIVACLFVRAMHPKLREVTWECMKLLERKKIGKAQVRPSLCLKRPQMRNMHPPPRFAHVLNMSSAVCNTVGFMV